MIPLSSNWAAFWKKIKSYSILILVHLIDILWNKLWKKLRILWKNEKVLGVETSGHSVLGMHLLSSLSTYPFTQTHPALQTFTSHDFGFRSLQVGGQRVAHSVHSMFGAHNIAIHFKFPYIKQIFPMIFMWNKIRFVIFLYIKYSYSYLKKFQIDLFSMLCIFLVYFNFKLRTNLFYSTANVNILVLNRNTNHSFDFLVPKLVIKQSEE